MKLENHKLCIYKSICLAEPQDAKQGAQQGHSDLL